MTGTIYVREVGAPLPARDPDDDLIIEDSGPVDQVRNTSPLYTTLHCTKLYSVISYTILYHMSLF